MKIYKGWKFQTRFAPELCALAIIDQEKAEVLQTRANRIAKARGFGKATSIVFGARDEVVSHVQSGYRKNTTDEYVSNAYRNNFGWKNTYYQCAETLVCLNVERNK